MKALPRSFYERHPADVAPALLGKILVRRFDGLTLTGRIVETEAYSSDDRASHTYRGLTERNKVMFGAPGHAYIYFSYGVHWCLNVSARLDTPAGGVLIRALEPLDGIDEMRARRGRDAARELTSGPGKLTQALNVDKSLYGLDMTQAGPLFIADGDDDPDNIRATGRIGISKAVEVPWRFIVDGNPCLSR